MYSESAGNKGTGGGEVKRGTGVKEEEKKKEKIYVWLFLGGGGGDSMGNILNNYVSIDRDKELEII